MRYTLYRYNPETCQYERARLSVMGMVWYGLSLVVVAALMMVGLLILHDTIIDSDVERALRQENTALEKHKIVLTSQLDELDESLAELQKKDHVLHDKFFGAPAEVNEQPEITISKQDLLLAGPRDFRKVLKKIDAKTEGLIERSSGSNQYFGNTFSENKENLSIAPVIPTLQPVQPWKSENVISGFGLRINPYHKGLYKHPGIDIAAVRGTNIVAPAGGIVAEIKYSNLQAGYGNYIEIDHGNGIVTRFAHVEDVKVRYNQKVKKGDIIATVGSSGGSIAPHVHYEIIRNGKNVDPVPYMIEGLSSEEHYKLKMISKKQNQSLD